MFVQPELVTVTKYVPVIPAVIGFAVVAVNPGGPDHAYDVPPDAVKVVVSPKQTNVFPLILQPGIGFTTNALLQVLVHLFSAVTVLFTVTITL